MKRPFFPGLRVDAIVLSDIGLGTWLEDMSEGLEDSGAEGMLS